MDGANLAQTTVVSDNHTSCAVVVLSINLEHSHDNKLKEVLNGVRQITNVPKELGADQKVEPDDGTLELTIF